MVAGHRSRLDVFFVKYRRREPPFLRLWNLYQAMDYAYLSAVNEMRRSFDQVARGRGDSFSESGGGTGDRNSGSQV